jgi:hypothetical protein
VDDIEPVEVIELDVKELAQDIAVCFRIKNVQRWTLRLWIATLLLRLAAWIAWFGECVVEMDLGEGEQPTDEPCTPGPLPNLP